MSKGSGGGGHGGGGSASGEFAKRLISRAGGVVAGASYLRTGMREESAARATGAFKGVTSTAAANKISLASEPVRMSVWKENGRMRVALQDGRHRAIAAKQAGATKIRATIQVRRPGHRTVTVKETVRL